MRSSVHAGINGIRIPSLINHLYFGMGVPNGMVLLLNPARETHAVWDPHPVWHGWAGGSRRIEESHPCCLGPPSQMALFYRVSRRQSMPFGSPIPNRIVLSSVSRNPCRLGPHPVWDPHHVWHSFLKGGPIPSLLHTSCLVEAGITPMHTNETLALPKRHEAFG